MVLLERVGHWGKTLRFQKLMPSLARFINLTLVDQDEGPQPLLQCLPVAAMLTTTMVMDSNVSNSGHQSKCFLLYVALVIALITGYIEKNKGKVMSIEMLSNVDSEFSTMCMLLSNVLDLIFHFY